MKEIRANQIKHENAHWKTWQRYTAETFYSVTQVWAWGTGDCIIGIGPSPSPGQDPPVHCVIRDGENIHEFRGGYFDNICFDACMQKIGYKPIVDVTMFRLSAGDYDVR